MSNQTKTDKALAAFKAGDVKQAFRLMFRFHGFSHEDKRTIQIAYECMAGKREFYSSLGIDTEDIINKAVACVSARYGVYPMLLPR